METGAGKFRGETARFGSDIPEARPGFDRTTGQFDWGKNWVSAISVSTTQPASRIQVAASGIEDGSGTLDGQFFKVTGTSHAPQVGASGRLTLSARSGAASAERSSGGWRDSAEAWRDSAEAPYPRAADGPAPVCVSGAAETGTAGAYGGSWAVPSGSEPASTGNERAAKTSPATAKASSISGGSDASAMDSSTAASRAKGTTKPGRTGSTSSF